MSEYYNILGVGKKATQEEIKKAFRKEAVEHQPDKGGDEATFKKINEAYNTLNDANKRKEYDCGGNPFQGGGFPGNGFQHRGGGFQQFGGADFMNMFFHQQRAPPGHFNRGPKQENKPKEVRQTIQVNMEDVFGGCQKNLNIKTTSKCSFCSKRCSVCKGSGVVESTVTKTMQHAKFVQIVKSKCEDCNGTGEKCETSTCEKCNKTGKIEKNSLMKIDIPARSFHDFVLKLKHPDEQNTFIVIKVMVKAPAEFHKNGDNLCYVCKLSLIDALLGTHIQIKHPSGETIVVDYNKRNELIKPDTILHIENKGVIEGSDLVVKFDIQYPKARMLQNDDNKDTFSSLRDNLMHIFNPN